MSKKVADLVWELAEPVVAGFGLRIWDVEYVREGGEYFLRLYLDKDTPVDIDDCEKVSRAMDPILDEEDPIPNSYTFEVCSAGCERTLKRPGDFEQFMGSKILVKLYQPKDGRKEWVGVLEAYGEEGLTLNTGNKTYQFKKPELANVRLYAEF